MSASMRVAAVIAIVLAGVASGEALAGADPDGTTVAALSGERPDPPPGESPEPEPKPEPEKKSQSRGKRDDKAALDLPEEELYLRGKELLERSKEEDARTYLRRYEQRYPRGPHAEEVKLLIADSYFQDSTPELRVEAVALYRQFLTYYPNHALACTAQLRIAQYYLREMRSCERDQTETHNAVDEYQRLLAAYPDCPSLEVARVELASAYDRLACAELKVVEYYIRVGEDRAAAHRLEDLFASYPEFGNRCYALRLAVEVWNDLGDPEPARASLARMEEDCAQSEELARARKVLRAAPPASAKAAATSAEPASGERTGK